MDKTASLRKLADLVAEREHLEHRITEAVAEARQAGATWTEVGTAVKMLRPNAQRKYGPLLEEERTVRVKD